MRERGRAAIDARVAADAKRGGPITKIFLSRALDAARGARDIVVNEYSALRDYMSFDEPSTWFLHPRARRTRLGFPGGPRNQARRTGEHGDFRRRRRRVSVRKSGRVPSRVGDARAAVAHDRVQQRAVGGRPEFGAQSVRQRNRDRPVRAGAAASPAPVPDFERYVEASGGVGVRVTQREELEPAIRAGLEHVRTERKQVLINVIGA